MAYVISTGCKYTLGTLVHSMPEGSVVKFVAKRAHSAHAMDSSSYVHVQHSGLCILNQYSFSFLGAPPPLSIVIDSHMMNVSRPSLCFCVL